MQNRSQSGQNKKFNILFIISTGILVVVLAVTFAISAIYSKIPGEDSHKDTLSHESPKDYKYHFSVIMYQLTDSFLTGFSSGVAEVAEKGDVFIEFINAEDIEEATKNINIAIASKADGIIAQGIYDEEYITAINRAIGKEIPVVFAYTDAQGTDRNCFVGYNAFELGKSAAKRTAEAIAEEGEVALLVQSFTQHQHDITSNLNILGFMDVMENYQNIEIVAIKKTNQELLSAEDITYEIISRYPDIDAIFCTSEKDTIGAAQVLIDLNRVGDMALIGTGAVRTILEYIGNVIHVSFDMNAKEMGKKSVESLIEIKEKTNSNDFIDVPFDIITDQNVYKYKK